MSATPGPWYWGDGWDHRPPADEDEPRPSNTKYADCQLYGADDAVIIPIRYDHYEPIWDIDDEECPSKEDRALMAAAPDLLDALKQAASALEIAAEEPTSNPAYYVHKAKEARAAIAKAEGAA